MRAMRVPSTAGPAASSSPGGTGAATDVSAEGSRSQSPTAVPRSRQREGVGGRLGGAAAAIASAALIGVGGSRCASGPSSSGPTTSSSVAIASAPFARASAASRACGVCLGERGSAAAAPAASLCPRGEPAGEERGEAAAAGAVGSTMISTAPCTSDQNGPAGSPCRVSTSPCCTQRNTKRWLSWLSCHSGRSANTSSAVGDALSRRRLASTRAMWRAAGGRTAEGMLASTLGTAATAVSVRSRPADAASAAAASIPRKDRTPPLSPLPPMPGAAPSTPLAVECSVRTTPSKPYSVTAPLRSSSSGAPAAA